MNLKIKRTVAGSVLEIDIEEKDEKEGIARALFYLQKDFCGLCKSQNVIWGSNKAKTDDGEFTYIKRICLACGATSTAGEYKSGGLFWKQWEEKYVKDPNQINEPRT